ncbi:hypothetical protein C1645_815006 [Glomus cerebriforme]|uniref:Uncharacterized protein n=1 Tax=Glomus cerebriforme TaxID=658196 RepID=A0A397TJR4_9GLOM|nr:hypothetical protein C1645_815006 [Glomus cerebriforme]
MSTAPATINPVATIMQPRLLTRGRFFHCTLNDGKFFLITYKLIRGDSDSSNDVDPDYNLNYDHEYVYLFHTVYYYVRCKFLPHSNVEDLLNKELDMNTLRNGPSLTPQQKLDLEESLVLKLYLRLSQETDEIST